ncbi:LysR family transcriptional regulator [Alginatibacterium sediminis]|uniref:LysR family transcriptional regulator n=1 Tax=Alginatibacterium sediminis TaxID=2164068 RepID=A0A420EL44_9ALTE|nr:LysR family transcriptional regulator [Alginatibacterium sediminis]RKF21408.1 LysR family transcriptional regulator [Alginatibacterium sediminis]
MKIEDLKLFVSVVEMGNFASVATAYGVPRANVSRRINTLEVELGFKLFARSTRQMTLTTAGRQYFAGIQAAIGQLDNAQHAAQSTQQISKGVVRIGLAPYSEQWLNGPLQEFRAQYPDIELDLVFSDSHLDLYKEGLDLTFRVGVLDDASYVAKPIVSTPLVCVASPDYLQSNGMPRQLDQLEQHECIRYRHPKTGTPSPWTFDGTDIDVHGHIVSNNYNFIVLAVQSGLGIALLPQHQVQQQLQSGQLEQIFSQYQSEIETIWVVFSERKSLSHAAQSVLDFFSQRITEYLVPLP